MSAERIYAIGDIHGQLAKLRAVHRLIERDQARHGPGEIVHIGDLVDRGPDAAGVVDYLMKGCSGGAPWVVLKGNHDRMMTLFLMAEPRRDTSLRAEYSWLSPPLGGLQTLASYGVGPLAGDGGGAAGGSARLPVGAALDALHAAARAAVPAEHLAFLEGLPLMHRTDLAVFVHAGIRPGVPLEAQDEEDLLWIRREFLDDPRDHGALIVHGHTPVEAIVHMGNRIGIDTGAGMGGPLSAIVLEPGGVWQLSEDGGRLPLVPR